jgi:phytanoyl-CoA hydroxylase
MSGEPNKTTIVLEPSIEDHDPSLYEGGVDTSLINGWSAVDDAQIDAYRERGYLVVRRAFDSGQVRAAREELEAMTHSDDPRCDGIHYEGAIVENLEGEPDARDDGPGDRLIGHTLNEIPRVAAETRARHVRKFMGFCAGHPPLAALSDAPALTTVLERIVGGPIRTFQEMALVKPPGGREKPWHQDHAYFNVPLDTAIVGVWIALDHVDVDNGCMVVLPGGHAAGPRLHFMRRDYQICDTDIDQTSRDDRLALPMAPGDLLLFDGKLPHGTPTNKTQGQRWAVQYHYVGKSVRTPEDEDCRDAFGGEGKGASC